jgi:hypothetical protein
VGDSLTERRALCDFCEDADATWVVDCDLGDANDGSGAQVVYRFACDGCRDKSSYMEPEVLTPEWRRRLRI